MGEVIKSEEAMISKNSKKKLTGQIKAKKGELEKEVGRAFDVN